MRRARDRAVVSIACRRGHFVLPRAASPRRRASASAWARAESTVAALMPACIAIGFLSPRPALDGMSLGGHVADRRSAIDGRVPASPSRRSKITGKSETSEIDVLDRLGTRRLDVAGRLRRRCGARRRIAGLPWVEHATVRKVYPRHARDHASTSASPMRIWQHGGELSLIDKGGTVIAPYASDNAVRLAAAGGRRAAPTSGGGLRLTKSPTVPDLRSRVKARRPRRRAGAGICISTTASRSCCRRTTSRIGAGSSSSKLDKDEDLLVARHRRGRSSSARPDWSSELTPEAADAPRRRRSKRRTKACKKAGHED